MTEQIQAVPTVEDMKALVERMQHYRDSAQDGVWLHNGFAIEISGEPEYTPVAEDVNMADASFITASHFRMPEMLTFINWAIERIEIVEAELQAQELDTAVLQDGEPVEDATAISVDDTVHYIGKQRQYGINGAELTVGTQGTVMSIIVDNVLVAWGWNGKEEGMYPGTMMMHIDQISLKEG
jgi:hypothetical protein